jgi:hypothetical protein
VGDEIVFLACSNVEAIWVSAGQHWVDG